MSQDPLETAPRGGHRPPFAEGTSLGIPWSAPHSGALLVGVIMGSQSDWETMRATCETLDLFEISNESRIVSAHRTPQQMSDYARNAASRGLQVVIAGAGGAAHLPGMVASMTPLPVIGVPVQSKALNGMDSLLSIAQMPGGVPVATMAIGRGGAINAALLAARIIGLSNDKVRDAVERHSADQTQAVLDNTDPS